MNIYNEAEEKLSALADLKIYNRALKMCRWWQFSRKKKYLTLISITRKIYNI